MRQFQDHDSPTLGQSVRATLMMLAFGLAILAFLISIDHPEWFRLRPMTGTAIAMSHASDDAAANAMEQGRTE